MFIWFFFVFIFFNEIVFLELDENLFIIFVIVGVIVVFCVFFGELYGVLVFELFLFEDGFFFLEFNFDCSVVFVFGMFFGCCGWFEEYFLFFIVLIEEFLKLSFLEREWDFGVFVFMWLVFVVFWIGILGRVCLFFFFVGVDIFYVVNEVLSR